MKWKEHGLRDGKPGMACMALGKPLPSWLQWCLFYNLSFQVGELQDDSALKLDASRHNQTDDSQAYETPFPKKWLYAEWFVSGISRKIFCSHDDIFVLCIQIVITVFS